MALRIEQLISAHQDLSNAMSHEIKTPLARMQFEIELAQRADHLEEVRQTFVNIKTDIDAIDRLIKATLNYAILERADIPLNLQAHDFATLLPAMVDMILNTAPPTAIDVQTVVPPDTGVVYCDVYLLELALTNLLINALRYATHRIEVSFQVHGPRYRLCLDDDGPGIAASDADRVFGSFVQLEPRRAGSGFGLGLALVKTAMNCHGGSASVERAPLGGARFVLVWPRPDAV